MKSKINNFLLGSILSLCIVGISNAQEVSSSNKQESEFLKDYNKKKEEFEKKKELVRRNAAINIERDHQEKMQNMGKISKVEMMNEELKKRGLLYMPKK